MGRMRHKARKEVLLVLSRIAKLLCFIVTDVAEVMGDYTQQVRLRSCKWNGIGKLENPGDGMKGQNRENYECNHFHFSLSLSLSWRERAFLKTPKNKELVMFTII